MSESQRFNALVPWIEKMIKRKIEEEELIGTLHEGALLVRLVNCVLPFHEKIVIAVDVLNNNKHKTENLKNFLQKLPKIGIDPSHIFDIEVLKDNVAPSTRDLDEIATTLEALKALIEQKGTPEDQNKWTRTAAETRAGQDKVSSKYKASNQGFGDITEAVRDFTQRTNDEKDLRYMKQGQQKWNLFETNYQRAKGITTEESLQEIDAFATTGKIPDLPPVAAKTVGGGFRKVLEETITADEPEETHTASRSTFTPGKGNAGKVVKGRAGMGTVKKGQSELVNKPALGGGNGAAFFEQFANKENKKFLPGGNGKKLW